MPAAFEDAMREVAATYLVFDCHGIRCAVPLAQVCETLRPLPTRRLTGASELLLGLAVIRGTPIPVVDGRRLFASGLPSEIGRFIVLKVGERRVALAVEQVIDIVRLTADTDTPPPLIRTAAAAAVSAIQTLDAELLFVLDHARILDDAAWEAVHSEISP